MWCFVVLLIWTSQNLRPNCLALRYGEVVRDTFESGDIKQNDTQEETMRTLSMEVENGQEIEENNSFKNPKSKDVLDSFDNFENIHFSLTEEEASRIQQNDNLFSDDEKQRKEYEGKVLDAKASPSDNHIKLVVEEKIQPFVKKQEAILAEVANVKQELTLIKDLMEDLISNNSQYDAIMDDEGNLTKIACESNHSLIQCPTGKHIRIISANYGRKSSQICPRYNQDINIKCFSKNSLNIVKDLCEGQKSCVVKAENSVFGDPCGGTFKYLKVEFKCLKP